MAWIPIKHQSRVEQKLTILYKDEIVEDFDVSKRFEGS